MINNFWKWTTIPSRIEIFWKDFSFTIINKGGIKMNQKKMKELKEIGRKIGNEFNELPEDTKNELNIKLDNFLANLQYMENWKNKEYKEIETIFYLLFHDLLNFEIYSISEKKWREIKNL